MCGIFGVIANRDTDLNQSVLIDSLYLLARMSQSRGKDSSGLCMVNQDTEKIDLYKGPIPITTLIKNKKVNRSIKRSFVHGKQSMYAFGHARLVTNGTQLNIDNNQPVIKNNIVGVHNGIVVNVDNLWDNNPLLHREHEIDTEVIFALIQKGLLNDGLILESAVSNALNQINGTVATAFIEMSSNNFILATNNGSLYTIQKNGQFVIFASEQIILKKLTQKLNLRKILGDYRIQPIKQRTGLVIDLINISLSTFSFSDNPVITNEKNKIESPTINKFEINPKDKQLSVVMDLNYIHCNPAAEKEKRQLDYPIEKIKQLKRCTNCILPETFPFIHFDQNGKCNFCQNYLKRSQTTSLDALLKIVEPYRKKNGEPDVLLPFSGGRDSTFTLHIVKTKLGLNPITYTYDWGMVTDLARRNIARICGKLGVENIIVAADIHWKRKNIKKNITAWLKNPELGMIPLFMAGDKYFFYYAYKIKKQLEINLEIWGINQLENTDFKTGFSGLNPVFNKKRIYSLSLVNQIKLLGFVAKNVLKSPGYLNQSVLDSFGSMVSRYMTPKKDYFHLFDFIKWDENEINNTIIDNYDWEKAVDTESTWRIGDGTASFYNYIYNSVVGFSENDTFRSNQIREGMITRDEALTLIYEENKPRYNSLRWYLDIINLDFEDTIKKINRIPALF